MIHYHGTPIGGTVGGAAKFLSGRHALVSHARPDHMAVVAEVCQSFVLDNGAFSQWKRGKEVDFAQYVDWVGKWYRHPGFDWALIPDVIGGTQEENDRMVERWCNEGVDPRRIGVPVWHLHEPLERLLRLASTWRIVALGSSGEWPTPGALTWWRRMAQAMDAVCEEGVPVTKLHGLRMMSTRIFPWLPLASADSTNAAVNQGSLSRFGLYKPPSSGTRATVIAERIEAENSAPVWRGAPITLTTTGY